MERNSITNTLFSFKNAKNGETLFRKANYESVINFIDNRTRSLEMNAIIILQGEYYKITRVVVAISELDFKLDDAIPYSYHVHVDVIPDIE